MQDEDSVTVMRDLDQAWEQFEHRRAACLATMVDTREEDYLLVELTGGAEPAEPGCARTPGGRQVLRAGCDVRAGSAPIHTRSDGMDGRVD